VTSQAIGTGVNGVQIRVPTTPCCITASRA
jgi:hypothetical protein